MTEAAIEHQRLQAMIAAFADGELADDEGRLVEDHLRFCARCQRELALQRSLSRALAEEPAIAASAILRRRIERIGAPALGRSETGFRWKTSWVPRAAAALIVIGVAGGAALVTLRGAATRPIGDVPVLRDALADCRRAMARNFPRKADLQAVGAGLPFPIRALDRPGAELFSTWKTTLAGAPAAGLAYRWRGFVVVQYAVATDLVQHQPGLAAALRRSGVYAASDQGQGVVAFIAEGSANVLVSDAPPEELRRMIL